MHDNPIGPKNMGLTLSDTARLSPSIITKIEVNNLVFQLGLHLGTLNFTRKIAYFY
jgi:hypothetical protein